MGDAKLKTTSVFALEHEGNVQSYREFSSIVTSSEPSQNVQHSTASSCVEIVRSNVASIHKVVLQERSDCLCVCVAS